MTFGDIRAIVWPTRADEPVLAAAAALSNTHDVHVSATLVSVAQAPAYGFETAGAAAAAGAWSEPLPVSARNANEEHIRLIRRLERFSRPVRVERVDCVEGAAAELAGVQARRAGLTIMPAASRSAQRATADGNVRAHPV